MDTYRWDTWKTSWDLGEAASRRAAKRARQNRWVKAQRQRVPVEAQVEARVVQYVEERLHLWAPKFGKDGWPDRLVVLGCGKHVWFEFKRRKFGSLTPAQRRRIPAMRRAREPVYIVKTFEQAVQILADYGCRE